MCPGADRADHSRENRWFMDIASTLDATDAIGILVRRDFDISLEGKIRDHCADRQLAEEEHRRGNEMIERALKSACTSKIFSMSYESLSSEHQWKTLWDFLHLSTTYMPKFHSGNKKYLRP